MKRKVILASQSPRRKQLLEQIGLEFEVRKSEYEENMKAKEDPYDLVEFLAQNKTRDVAQYYEDAIVIGADTIIVYKDKILGKPHTAEKAQEMLIDLSGSKFLALSGFAIIDTKTKKIISGVGEAKVKFKELSEEEIENYISTGEPLDKAGAHALQEKGAVFAEKIEGDFYSIVGLPINKVYVALQSLGINLLK